MTVMIPHANSTVVYTVHSVLLNFSKAFGQCLVDPYYNLAGFLPVFALKLLNGQAEIDLLSDNYFDYSSIVSLVDF